MSDAYYYYSNCQNLILSCTSRCIIPSSHDTYSRQISASRVIIFRMIPTLSILLQVSSPDHGKSPLKNSNMLFQGLIKSFINTMDGGRTFSIPPLCVQGSVTPNYRGNISF